MKSVSLTMSAIPVFKSVIPRKTSIPILNHVLVTVRDGQSFGTATDLDVHVTMPVDAGTVPGLYVIIGQELVLTQVKPDRFPVAPSWYSEPFLPVPVSILKRALTCVCREESRYTLNAVLLRVPRTSDSPVVISATDGHRLYVQHLPNPGNLPAGDYLIPRDTVELLARHVKGDAYFKFLAAVPAQGEGEDKVPAQPAELRIVTPTFGLYSRTVTGQFPNYEAVMPHAFPHHGMVAQRELEAAIKTVLPFADKRSSYVNMAFSASSLTLSASNDGYSKSVAIPCTLLDTPTVFDGVRYLADTAHAFGIVMPMRGNAIKGGMEVSVNILFVQDMVKGMGTGDVYFGWQDGNHAFGMGAHSLLHGATEVGPVVLPEPEVEAAVEAEAVEAVEAVEVAA